jgi:thiol-disulfide isomerase/thioredoxin
MTKFLSVIDGVLKPYYKKLLYIFLFITFSVVVYYAYKKYYVSQKSGFTDVANANRNNKVVTVYMFHVDWCPHCKKALPEWELFKNKYDGKEMNGYTIETVDIDCTNETSDVTTALNKFKIESYPTIKMEKDGNIIEFESKITESTLEKFVDTMLN